MDKLVLEEGDEFGRAHCFSNAIVPAHEKMVHIVHA